MHIMPFMVFGFFIGWLIEIPIHSVSISRTNTNTNIFGLKKSQIQLKNNLGWQNWEKTRQWILRLVFANMETNICHTLIYLRDCSTKVEKVWQLVLQDSCKSSGEMQTF